MKETPDRYQMVLQIQGCTCLAFLIFYFLDCRIEHTLWKLLRKQSLDDCLKLSFLQPAFKIRSLLWKKATFLYTARANQTASPHTSIQPALSLLSHCCQFEFCLFSLTADESLFSGFITVSQFILCYLVWKAAESNSDSWKSSWVPYGTERKGISKQWWGFLIHPGWHIGCYTSLWAWPLLFLTASSWNLMFTALILSDYFYFLFGFLQLWLIPCSWTLSPLLL